MVAVSRQKQKGGAAEHVPSMVPGRGCVQLCMWQHDNVGVHCLDVLGAMSDTPGYASPHSSALQAHADLAIHVWVTVIEHPSTYIDSFYYHVRMANATLMMPTPACKT